MCFYKCYVHLFVHLQHKNHGHGITMTEIAPLRHLSTKKLYQTLSLLSMYLVYLDISVQIGKLTNLSMGLLESIKLFLTHVLMDFQANIEAKNV